MPSKEENDLAIKYFQQCRQKYSKESASILSDVSEKDLLALKVKKFCTPSMARGSYSILDTVWNLIDSEWENPSPKIARLTEEGFSVYNGPSLRNVTYVSSFTKESILNIREFIIKSEIKSILERYYLSSIGVCNVRAYRYTHDPEEKNTHKEEKFDSTTQFNQHKDGLLPDTVKIMIFKNAIGDNLDSSDGVTELYASGDDINSQSWISPGHGASPSCLIFESNNVLHRANRPAPGRIRDVIELTIIPKIENDFPVIASGAHAGYPENLKTHWSKI